MRLIVGLTGMSGAGKSTVCRAFAESGFEVIDCDLSAREVVLPGSPALDELHDRLSPELILPDGTLDRRKTAELIFHSEEKRGLFLGNGGMIAMMALSAVLMLYVAFLS